MGCKEELKILYVEDEKDISEEIFDILSMFYKNITVKDNGLEGLQSYKSEAPDIIITDIQMPKMDGLGMIEEIRKVDTNIPVIITTAFTDPEYMVSSIDLKVNSYVTKPTNPKKLFSAIESVSQEICAKRLLEEQNQTLFLAFDKSDTMIFSIKNRKVNFSNSAFLKYLELDCVEDFEKNPIEQFFIFHSHKVDGFSSIDALKGYFESKEKDPKLVSFRVRNREKEDFFQVNHIKDQYSSSDIYTLQNITSLALEKLKLGETVKKAKKQIKQQKKALEINAKLAEMGSMIRSINHQWAQPLNNIYISSQSIEMSVEDKDYSEILYLAQNINKSVEFMTETMRSFKNFLSPSKSPKRFLVSSMIKNLVDVLGKEYEENKIDVNINEKSKVELVSFENELKQVLLTLLNNSRDAFIEKEISKREVNIDIFEQKDECQIIVHDNAGGIPQDILQKVFDNYITTKGDKGTGVGLSIAKMIIEGSLGGKISVKNQDNGAFFTLSIPIEGENIERA